MSESKVKYTVSLPAKVAEKLDYLSELESMSKPETLRRAIALYSFIHRETVQGDSKLCIVDQSDRIVKEVVMS